MTVLGLFLLLLFVLIKPFSCTIDTIHLTEDVDTKHQFLVLTDSEEKMDRDNVDAGVNENGPSNDYYFGAATQADEPRRHAVTKKADPAIFGGSPTNVKNVASDNAGPSPEERLYKHLFGRGYIKNVRPARDPNEPVVVRVGMCVMMIEDLIEREQMMIMAACAKMLWDDDRLTWDPAKFSNITWMAVSNQQVWFPDIVIVNSPDPAALTRKLTNVGLSYRGELGYFPSGRLFTRCNLVITFFPFDWQQCEVRFESWIYPTKYLELDLFPGTDTIDVKEHYANYQWTIKGHRIQTEIVSYDGHNFSSITVVFIFRRKSLYFSLYFIFPELLLALLQTLSHTLPVEHPGRMTMLTALFIGSSVTHSGVAAHIPKSSDTVSLLQFYMTVMSINLAFSLLVSFLMLYAVLRYPNKEPTFKAMIIAFLSIVWPQARQSNLNRNPSQSVRSKVSPQQSDGDASPRNHNQANGFVCHEASTSQNKYVVNVRLRNMMPTPSTTVTSPHNVVDLPIFDDGGQRGGACWDPCGVSSQYMTKQRCITSSPMVVRSNNDSATTDDNLLMSPVYVKQRMNDDDRDMSDLRLLSSGNEGQTPIGGYNNTRARQQNKYHHYWPIIERPDTLPINKDDEKKAKKEKKDKKNHQHRHHRQQSAEDGEAQELKRRWLVYCVALDKLIMYGVGVFNVIVPILLFMAIPLLNEFYFMSQGSYQPYQPSE